jgi:hypothetical protein
MDMWHGIARHVSSSITPGKTPVLRQRETASNCRKHVIRAHNFVSLQALAQRAMRDSY